MQEAVQKTASCYTKHLQDIAGKCSRLLLRLALSASGCLGRQLLPHCIPLTHLQMIACAPPAAAAGPLRSC